MQKENVSSIESIANSEDNVQVLRLLTISGWRKAEEFKKELDRLRKIEAEANQLKLQMEDQRTIFQKLIFGHGVETRSKDRARRTKEDEQLTLHSQSLVPAPSVEETAALKDQGVVHSMTTEEILEEAKARGLPEDANEWKEIPGLTEDSTEVTMIERQYILLRHKRKKYRHTPSKGTDREIIVTAKGPEKLLPGCSYSIDFALSVVRDKYEYHLPLERQTRAMEALGLKNMGTKTLFNLCRAVATHLEPVCSEIRRDILAANLCVHMDETPWPIFGQDDDGYMWVLSNQAGSVYAFEPTRSGKVADEMLKGYEGPMLTDAYNGYDRFTKEEKVIVAKCWAHGRRKFFEIGELYPECDEILDLMKKLFAVEHEAKTYEELGILRQEKSKPLTDEIFNWLVAHKLRHLPESAFTKAINYHLKRWKEFTVFLTDVRIPLTNNEAERSIRHAVMGRKNFYGSKTINGADVAAVLYTVIESCKKVDIDPTTFIRQAILRNNHGELQITPLQFAKDLRNIAA